MHKENQKALTVAIQEMGLEANAKKTNLMFLSREENEDKITT